ncbi:Maf family protein [Psychrobacillus psychrodurans]|uniref:Maf family protein n=1 Tax=Psychrobacillus psychrodurans TaxID=126157 RepID=UPI001F4E228F|nr:Maf family protein [Psychrobacillus psychrodurans]MCK1996559.1 Maf family protein [Psychrobacillus psychrodurans]
MKLTTNHRFILASESPRRKELFSKLGIPFEVKASGAAEIVEENLSVEKVAMNIAIGKTTSIINENPSAIVIAADTIVSFGDELLMKPIDNAEAKKYLQKLSGNTHQVTTGVAIYGEGCSISFAETTSVKFFDLPEDQIDAYVATGDSLDKAGAYGIQTMGGLFVESIQGDYNNVIGLPISRLYKALLSLRLIELERVVNS